MAVMTFTKSGTKAPIAATLDKKVFGVTPKNHALLKAAYEAYLANGRGNYAWARSRGNVSGGGRKPWQQKGTGRARFGSSRNPIWRGGGVAFGPTGNENYEHKLSTTMKRQAIRQALSIAADDKKVIVIEDVAFKDHKTAEAAKFLQKIDANNNALLVVTDKTEELLRATRNISSLKVVTATYLNVFDVLNADHVVITSDGLKLISEWLKISAAKAAKGKAA